MRDAGEAPRVLVVGSRRLDAEAIAGGLRCHGWDAQGSGPEADELPPAGVVVLDAMLADEHLAGVDARLRASHVDARRVLLVPEQGSWSRTAKKLGADAVLTTSSRVGDLAEQLRDVAAGSVPAPRRPSRTRSGELTSRERGVLVQLARGLDNEAVGRALGISTHTVRTHVQSLYAKLGVSSRFAAVSEARRLRVLDDSGRRHAG